MLNPNWSVPIGQPLTFMNLNHNHGHGGKFLTISFRFLGFTSIYMLVAQHNIIKIHSNVLWD